jgi:hypothetical protein
MELKQSAQSRAPSTGAGLLDSHHMSDRVASGLDLNAIAAAAADGGGEGNGSNGGGVSESAAQRCACLPAVASSHPVPVCGPRCPFALCLAEHAAGTCMLVHSCSGKGFKGCRQLLLH